MRRGGRLGGLWDAEGVYRLVDQLKPKLGARGEVVKIPVSTLAQAVMVLMLTADELDPRGGKPRAAALTPFERPDGPAERPEGP